MSDAVTYTPADGGPVPKEQVLADNPHAIGVVGRNWIEQILAQPGVVGIAVYTWTAATSGGQQMAPALVGIKADGTLMTDTTIDNHSPCPPYC